MKLDYKASLKGTDAEEILDLLIYRPISFQFVRLIYNTNITPNQISTVALIFGVLAGVFYTFSTELMFIFAAISFFICNVLDCADGQLARLKKNGTRIGRVVDGLIDYITAISTFIGIAIGYSISENPIFVWSITAFAAFSRAIQNMYFDNYRNLYLRYVYNIIHDVNSDIKEFEGDLVGLRRLKGRYIAKLLVYIYLKYCYLQKAITKDIVYDVTPEEYKKKNKFLLRCWSWLGSTTHLTLAIILTLFFKVDLYLFITITLGNFIFIILFILQKIVLGNFKIRKNAGSYSGSGFSKETETSD